MKRQESYEVFSNNDASLLKPIIVNSVTNILDVLFENSSI